MTEFSLHGSDGGSVDREFFLLHSELCKTLANAKRQMIMGVLRDGEASVTEIAQRTGISQANLSQHLARMRAHGVVKFRGEGTKMLYSLSNPKLIQAFDLITEVLSESMNDRKQSVDYPGEEGR